MAMRPLEKLPTIRAKLGSVIVFAVAVTLLVSYVLIAFYLRNSPRDTEEIAALGLAGKAALGPLDHQWLLSTPVELLCERVPEVTVVEVANLRHRVRP